MVRRAQPQRPMLPTTACIVVGGILTPGVNTLHVTVFGVGGLLTGWMDFNNDGQFDGDTEKLDLDAQWRQPGQGSGSQSGNLRSANHDPGQRSISGRLRRGSVGVSQAFRSLAPPKSAKSRITSSRLNSTPGDYNHDGIVDQADFNCVAETNRSTTSRPSPALTATAMASSTRPTSTFGSTLRPDVPHRVPALEQSH